MRFASCAHRGRHFAACVDGDVVRPLEGIAELGRDTPRHVLADPPLSGEQLSLEEVTLRPVVPQPGKILCMGLNYREHVAEGVYEVPDYPVLFSKFSDALIAAGEAIVAPPESEAVDYEAELAFIVGRPVRRTSGAEAMDAIAGYTVANDVTMRDYQYRTHQWLPGKSWARSTPLGPFLVTPDEVGDPHELDIWLELNGQRMQSANTRQLIFDIPAIIDATSEFVPLWPGDVVLTGTPSGVGYRREPQVRLRDGDRIVIEVERVGRLENPVVAEQLGA